MIVPSIDLMSGTAVQLVGGREQALDAGDPIPIARAFGVAGEIAVVDLDAALGKGSNAKVIRTLLELAPCRVGGGIRSVKAALDWLDAGATSIVLGTAARPEILKELPPERVIVALDAVRGEVVVEGWRTRTGRQVEELIGELKGLAGGFLVTFVEREGRLGGIDLDQAAHLAELTEGVSLTVAGGITTVDEIAALDRIGVDAQVGMALYTGKMALADAVTAPLRSDRPDGLWPTVVVDEHGVALGLVWSDRESVRQAMTRRRGIYHSRSRGLWTKGATSGATQELLAVDLDCDRDALRFTVRQHGDGFCHDGTWSCWGDTGGLPSLDRLLAERVQAAPEGSYTKRLLDDPDLLRRKLLEEATELAEAVSAPEVAWEAADLAYFALVTLARGGATLGDVERELDRRALRVRRRSESEDPEAGGSA